MQEDEILSFNFWPSFADLMLALVLVLCLILFLVFASKAIGTVDLKKVAENQVSMVNSIALDYKVTAKKVGDNTYGIYFHENKDPDIRIYNELNVQRVTFSDKLLFEPDHID